MNQNQKDKLKFRLTLRVDENSILQIKAEDISNPNHVEKKAIINDQLVNYEKINLIKDDKSNYKSNINKYKKLREENLNDPSKYFKLSFLFSSLNFLYLIIFYLYFNPSSLIKFIVS